MTLRSPLLQILRLFTPSYDPISRARIHRRARSLIICSPWPSGTTSTAHEVAQLALVRLLYLQKMTRRQARCHQTEAAVLLTRSAVDTCILGLYCTYVPDALESLNANNSKALQRLFEPIIDEEVFTTEMIDAGLSELTDPSALPFLGTIVKQITSHNGPAITDQLYLRVYGPISTLYTHASGVTLLRHVRANNRVKSRPTASWTMKGAVNTVDTCVGLLAAAISAPDSAEQVSFDRYGLKHWNQTPMPATTFFLKDFVSQLQVKNLPAAVRSLRDMRTYITEGAGDDDYETRRHRIRDGFQTTLAIFATPIPDALLETFVDRVMELSNQPSTDTAA